MIYGNGVSQTGRRETDDNLSRLPASSVIITYSRYTIDYGCIFVISRSLEYARELEYTIH